MPSKTETPEQKFLLTEQVRVLALQLTEAEDRAHVLTLTKFFAVRDDVRSMVGCFAIVIVGAAILVAVQVHWVAGAAVVGGGLAGLSWLSIQQTNKRLAELTVRFGADAAAHIMSKHIWQGATPEMILESIGRPVDVDEKVLKSKTKHTYKYYQTGKNKFALRVMFEDGVCVGWDDKR